MAALAFLRGQRTNIGFDDQEVLDILARIAGVDPVVVGDAKRRPRLFGRKDQKPLYRIVVHDVLCRKDEDSGLIGEQECGPCGCVWIAGIPVSNMTGRTQARNALSSSVADMRPLECGPNA